MNKVLIVVPAESRQGGVSSFYKTLRKYLSYNIQYFYCASSDKRITFPIMLILKYFIFGMKLLLSGYDMIILNPSMGSTALVRDGIFLKIAKIFGRRVVVFMHGWNVDYERKLVDKYHNIFKNTYFKADAFYVLSPEFKKKLHGWGYDKNVINISTCVDDDILNEPITRDSQDMKREKFNIIFLGRIEKAKGIEEILLSYKIVKQKYPFVTLVCAGAGNEMFHWRKYAENMNLTDVSFPGYIDNKRKDQLLKNSHCFFMPSYTEGMPCAVLEAMAYGLPVVTRKVGGLKYIFKDPEMGYITDSLNPEYFAQCIIDLIESPRRCIQICNYNRQYISKHCLASQIAEKLTCLRNI